jgi:hypothetical protein
VSARRSSIAGVTLAGCILAASIGTGCGDERPPVTNGTTAPQRAGGGGVGTTDEPKDTRPPGCGTEPDGTQCDCLDAPLFIDPPTIYFVLDRSGSMGSPDKWNQVRVVVGKIMRGLGPRANFGATMFPGSSTFNACVPGEEIMTVRNGDAPSSGVDGPTTAYLLAVTRVAPFGGTPTGATLEAVRTKLTSVPGRKYVILATDGAPNCNPAASCGFDQCQLNIANVEGCPAQGPKNCCEEPGGFREDCNDGIRTSSAIAALKSVGIPVYVVGLPGAAPYGALLDQMATAGGTARATSPKYFAVDSATEALILAALKQIAAQITGTCVFDLKEPPADPSLVNVYMDDVVLPFEPLNGWKIDGKTVTLLGTACDRVKAGDVLDVRMIVGCPRREPH